MSTRGFTLIELLFAIALLSIVCWVVFESFTAVTSSIEGTQATTEELRLRQFLARNISTNFASAHSSSTYEDDTFSFVGSDGEDTEGPNDAIRFCSSAPLLGGMGLPGDIKEVRYEIAGGGLSAPESEGDTDERVSRTLVATETPLMGGNVQELEGDTGNFVPDSSYESPSWEVPIRSLDIQYFDGEEWVDEWDSKELGRLPWCVDIKINFAKTESQLEQEEEDGIDPEENPDFEMVVPLPLGLGVIEDLRQIPLEGMEQPTGAASQTQATSPGATTGTSATSGSKSPASGSRARPGARNQ
ncbi:MAG: type II secretion system protein [Candidatus Hydrogenedentes bacterium]|nr:type II secretion system protein [Candidatus Hydrogenedentota bacterium]